MPRVVDVALQVGQTPVGAPGRVRDGLLREEAGRGGALIEDDDLDIENYARGYVERLNEDVMARLRGLL